MLHQLVQSIPLDLQKGRRRVFSCFVSSGVETAKPKKIPALRSAV
jgi:hypothetical protein